MSHVEEERIEVKLPRVLGPLAAFSAVVGSVIGSGIFLVAAKVADNVPFMGGILLVWVIGGIFSGAGALTLAELGAMLPQAGGLYVFLRAAYGSLPAFLFGWAEFLVVRSGSMATLAAAFAQYFAHVVAPPGAIPVKIWEAGAAVLAITVVTIVNVLGARRGGTLQVIGTALKVGGIAILIALPFVLGGGSVANSHAVLADVAGRLDDLQGHDGGDGQRALGVRRLDQRHAAGRGDPRPGPQHPAGLDPRHGRADRRLRRDDAGLPLRPAHVRRSRRPAETPSTSRAPSPRIYCDHLLGRPGVIAISLLVMCSTFIALNGNALAGPRAYFAMARDGLFPAALCRVHPTFQTPANAIIAQAIWAILLIVPGTFLIMVPPTGWENVMPGWILVAWKTLNKTPLYDVLYTYVIFGA